MKFLADFVKADSFGSGTGGADQTFNGFAVGFAAKQEGLVMHREHILGSAVLNHFPSLFRIAVVSDPWLVRSDGHDGQIRCACTLGRSE